MDNFNLDDKRPGGSIDGFMRPNTRKGSRSKHLPNFRHNKPTTSANDDFGIDRVDDFKSPEGFVPMVQMPIMQPGATNKPDDFAAFETASGKPIKSATAHADKPKRSRFLHRSRRKEHNGVHKKHRKLKIALRSFGVLMVLAVLGVGGLTLKAYFKTKNVLKGGGTGAVALTKNVDPTLLKGEGDGRVNVLVLGKGGPGHDGPDLTDTLIVASIDPIAKETALLSIPRDLWVKTSRGQSKVNAVYANAKYSVLNSYTYKNQTDDVKKQAEATGIKAIEDTISSAMGIPLHYYVMVDFTAFKQAIDTVGGIDIDVKTALYDPSVAWQNNNKALIADVGLQHFDGQRALLYARSRKGSLRGDFDRNDRQREVILALKSKLLTLNTFANPVKLNQLIDAFGDHVATDFSLNEMLRVYDIAKQIDASKVLSIGLADPPNNFVTTGMLNGQSIVQPRAGLFNYTDIQAYVRNALRDSYLKSEDANVIVLNGTTTTGLATLKSTELKSYGYNVTQVADAPTKTYTKTVLVDMTKGVKKYTLNYLEKRLGVKAVTTLPDTTIVPGTADFVIILGSSEAGAN